MVMKFKWWENFTDIDDKIINKISSTNQTLKEITSYYYKLISKNDQ